MYRSCNSFGGNAMERSSFCAFTEAFFYKLQVLFPEFSESIKRDKKGIKKGILLTYYTFYSIIRFY